MFLLISFTTCYEVLLVVPYIISSIMLYLDFVIVGKSFIRKFPIHSLFHISRGYHARKNYTREMVRKKKAAPQYLPWVNLPVTCGIRPSSWEIKWSHEVPDPGLASLPFLIPIFEELAFQFIFVASTSLHAAHIGILLTFANIRGITPLSANLLTYLMG